MLHSFFWVDHILLFIHLSMDMWVVSTLGIYDDKFCVEPSYTGFGVAFLHVFLIFCFRASVSFSLHISISLPVSYVSICPFPSLSPRLCVSGTGLEEEVFPFSILLSPLSHSIL